MEGTRPNNVFLNMHKTKPSRFCNVTRRRDLESKILKDNRRSRRTMNFNSRRNITNQENSDAAVIKNTVVDRKLALQKYKEERDAAKQIMKQKQRPPFVVGIPHHGASPILRNVTNRPAVDEKKVIEQPKEVRNQRVTRASKRAAQGNVRENKPVNVTHQQPEKTDKILPAGVCVFPFTVKNSVFCFQANKVSSAKKLTLPLTPRVLKRSEKKKTLCHPLMKSVNINQPAKLSGEPLAVPLSPLDDRSESTALQESDVPNSPLATLDSRDEENVCSGVQDENIFIFSGTELEPTEEGSSASALKEVIPSVETQDVNSNVTGETADQSTFQRGRLEEATKLLLDLAVKWETTTFPEEVPLEILDEIDSLVGQTRLLTRDKFKQFERLINEFENVTGTHVITVDDLNGFWDMMYLQVDPLLNRYADLENLKSNNWVKPEPVIKKRKRVKKDKVLNICLDKDHTVQEMSTTGETSTKTPRRSTRLMEQPTPMKYPMLDSGYFNEHGDTNTKTPRRSVRLTKQQPTPMKCGICDSGNCSKHDNTLSKTPRSARKTPRSTKNVPQSARKTPISTKNTPKPATETPSSAKRRSQQSTLVNSCTQETNDENKENVPKKKFVLKPSNLVLNSSNLLNLGAIPKVPRMSRRLRRTEAVDSEEEVNTERTTRQSTRQSSARKVTFDLATEDKTSNRLPVTPYQPRSGGRRTMDSDQSPI